MVTWTWETTAQLDILLQVAICQTTSSIAEKTTAHNSNCCPELWQQLLIVATSSSTSRSSNNTKLLCICNDMHCLPIQDGQRTVLTKAGFMDGPVSSAPETTSATVATRGAQYARNLFLAPAGKKNRIPAAACGSATKEYHRSLH